MCVWHRKVLLTDALAFKSNILFIKGKQTSFHVTPFKGYTNSLFHTNI